MMVDNAQLHPNMIKFVDLFLKSNIHEKLERRVKDNHGTADQSWYLLLKAFLYTEFKDQTRYARVLDLPEQDKLLLIDYLSCQLGLKFCYTYSPLVYMYEKYSRKLEERTHV